MKKKERSSGSFPRKAGKGNDPKETTTGRKKGVVHYVMPSGTGGAAKKLRKKLQRAGLEEPVRPRRKNQPNDYCKCGSGLKGKKCHLKPKVNMAVVDPAAPGPDQTAVVAVTEDTKTGAVRKVMRALTPKAKKAPRDGAVSSEARERSARSVQAAE